MATITPTGDQHQWIDRTLRFEVNSAVRDAAGRTGIVLEINVNEQPGLVKVRWNTATQPGEALVSIALVSQLRPT